MISLKNKKSDYWWLFAVVLSFICFYAGNLLYYFYQYEEPPEIMLMPIVDPSMQVTADTVHLTNIVLVIPSDYYEVMMTYQGGKSRGYIRSCDAKKLKIDQCLNTK
ncbi:hypothetical protein D9V86_11255 [Bacteroidetes/Chlorobi group bacterium ChocPot_Mid]|nr:MAG: hypothetical protein D9V86_11255 [Bacteroidetes/Chlorobi group bacterium ChocPot_Mid]